MKRICKKCGHEVDPGQIGMQVWKDPTLGEYYLARLALSCGHVLRTMTPRNDELPFSIIMRTLGTELDLQLTPEEAGV